MAGVKFPTGSTSRLREETQEGAGQEGPIASGIHGHDLTLGSGSYDGLVGTSAQVKFPGGILDVERTPEGSVLLTGPAEHVFDGVIDDAWLERKEMR